MRFLSLLCFVGIAVLTTGCGGGGGAVSSVSTSRISLVTSYASPPFLRIYGPLAGSNQPTSYSAQCYGIPSFSPDGTMVGFSSTYGIPEPDHELPCPPPMNTDPVQTHIYLASVHYGGATRLQHSGYGYGPSFSWDSRKVVFCRWGVGNPGICIINIDGSDEHMVTGISGRSPAFSPDGMKIVYVTPQDPTQNDIYVANVDGTGVKRLTNSAANELSPVFSPDGSKIVYMTSPVSQVCVMNADGSGSRVVATGRTGRVKFSPDSRELLYTAEAGPAWGLFSVPVGGGTPRLLMPLTSAQCDFICL